MFLLFTSFLSVLVDAFVFREVPDFLNLSEERVHSLADERLEKYLQIHSSEERFDYSFFWMDYRLIDGGIITNEKQPFKHAFLDTLTDVGLQISTRIVDAEEFVEKVEYAGQAEKIKLRGL